MKKQNRMSTLIEIDNLLNKHCHPCDNPKKSGNVACKDCPIGHELTILGKRLGFADKNVKIYAPRGENKPWTMADEKILIDAHKSKMRYIEIAELLERTKASVESKIKVFQRRGRL